MPIQRKDIPIPSFEGEPLEFVVDFPPGENAKNYDYDWKVFSTGVPYPQATLDKSTPGRARWDTSGTPAPRSYEITVDLTAKPGTPTPSPSVVDWTVNLQPRAFSTSTPTQVMLRRTASAVTPDVALWVILRNSTKQMSFDSYERFLRLVFCDDKSGYAGHAPTAVTTFRKILGKRYLPYNDADAYRLLKAATEAFVMVNCGVKCAPAGETYPTYDTDTGALASQYYPPQNGCSDQDPYEPAFTPADRTYIADRLGVSGTYVDQLWNTYTSTVNGGPDPRIPYLALIRNKLRDVFPDGIDVDGSAECLSVVRNKLNYPCLMELIWSYWHEEGMLVQTMNAITRRFQNIRGPETRDPLAGLEIDPLRSANNLLWGYLQDEQHRLGIERRVYEYDHHYGFMLHGKAVPPMRAADSRSRFLEAFHNLLYLCSVFFREDDDTTVISDGFPVLNALKDVHLLLSEGAHNQFGDLPTTARIEMLMQQWILARPEFREFLPTRVMVAYPERWMDRVDAMKNIQNWTDVSIIHFHNLAEFGEQLLLSIRYGAWTTIYEPGNAVNWLRFWRSEIQGYIHAYRAATGVDLTIEVADERQARARYVAPAVHLRNRLAAQLRSRAAGGQLAGAGLEGSLDSGPSAATAVPAAPPARRWLPPGRRSPP
jgi:hypothetical protein